MNGFQVSQANEPLAHQLYESGLLRLTKHTEVGLQEHTTSSIYSSVPDIGYHYLCHDMIKTDRIWKPFDFLFFFFFSDRDLSESEVCCRVIISVFLCSSGLDLWFSWIQCSLLSGFTLSFS